MYINENGWMPFRPVSGSNDRVQMTEASQDAEPAAGGSDPGYAPISPETPSWGPPAGDNSPGFAPISPETPSWGPPPGDDSPGFAPISPDTPSWGPPPGGDNSPGFAPISPDTPSWGPPPGNPGGSGGGSNRPVVIIPGQIGCVNCGSGSSGNYANVRFLHAAVNQPAVHVRLGNRTVINNLQYGNSTPYYLENGGNTLVTIEDAQTGQTLFRRNIRFSGQNAYTVSIINDGSGITAFTLTDTPCSSRGAACVRAVNLSPNSGPVDIFLSGYGRLVSRLGQLDASGYYSVGQGGYRAFVSEALPCTNNNAVIMADTYAECNNTRIAYMDSSNVNLMNGVTYTMYIIGMAYQFPALQILTLESDLVY